MTRTEANLAWSQLYETTEKWFKEPDRMVLRVSLAIPAALSMGQCAAWMLIVGPPGSGKSRLYLKAASVYRPHVYTYNFNLPGLVSLQRDRKGEGILKRLGSRGLWLINDFSSILSQSEDKRMELIGAMREIYDGRWEREKGGGGECWVGTCNLLGGATDAVDRYYRVIKELGDRFLRIRTPRKSALTVWRESSKQQGMQNQIDADILQGASHVFEQMDKEVRLSEGAVETIAAWADLACYLHAPVYMQGTEITGIGQADSGGRTHQMMCALARGDMALGHSEEETLALIERIAYDSGPRLRGAILRLVPSQEPFPTKAEIVSALDTVADYELERSLEELQAIKLIEKRHWGRENVLEPGKLLLSLRDAAKK